MAEPLDTLDITDRSEVRELVEEVIVSNRPRTLRIDRRDVALISPWPEPKKRLRGRRTSADDPLWKIVGTARTEGQGDVSRNHDSYLADAYADHHK